MFLSLLLLIVRYGFSQTMENIILGTYYGAQIHAPKDHSQRKEGKRESHRIFMPAQLIKNSCDISDAVIQKCKRGHDSPCAMNMSTSATLSI